MQATLNQITQPRCVLYGRQNYKACTLKYESTDGRIEYYSNGNVFRAQ